MLKFIIFILIIFNIFNYCYCYYDYDNNNNNNNNNYYPIPQYLDNKNDDKKGISYFPKVNGLKMHIRCIFNNDDKMNNNTGNLLIFESGYPYFSTSLSNIIKEFSSNNSSLLNELNIYASCFIDRYGYGWSDLSDIPIPSYEFVKRLKKSINQISKLKNRKFYYCAFSWGAVNSQIYKLLYPNDILGILSIDGVDIGVLENKWWSNQTIQLLENYLLPSNSLIFNSQKRFLKYCNENDCPLSWINSTEPLPKTSIKITQLLFTMNDHKNIKAAIQEFNILVDSINYLKNIYSNNSSNNTYPFGNMPLVLISVPKNQLYINSQLQFLNFSSNSRQFIGGINTPLGKPKHFIPFYEPELIISSLKVLLSLNK